MLFLLLVYDPNEENLVIGRMTVTVEILDALNAIRRELHENQVNE